MHVGQIINRKNKNMYLLTNDEGSIQKISMNPKELIREAKAGDKISIAGEYKNYCIVCEEIDVEVSEHVEEYDPQLCEQCWREDAMTMGGLI